MMTRVSHAEIDSFFTEYVYGFIAGDIQREIDRARGGDPAGNPRLLPLARLARVKPLRNSASARLVDFERRHKNSGRASGKGGHTAGPPLTGLCHIGRTPTRGDSGRLAVPGFTP